MSSKVDISRLAVDRSDSHSRRVAVRRRMATRYLLPAAIVIGFLALLGWAARDALLPARQVTVMPVIARRASGQQAGRPLFSAAGWVEARPTPVLVTALAGGVVQRLLVVEDQPVEAAQPVARLIDADARLALQQAEAAVAAREAELQSAEALAVSARTNLDQPVHLEAALAEAESRLAEAETELGDLPFEIREAEARLQLARHDFDRKTQAGQALPGKELQRSRAELDRALAESQRLAARKPRLADRAAALRRKSDALRRQLELKTSEVREAAEAQSGVAAARAHLKQATLAVETAKLHLERMTVRAPVAGRVLELIARPGSRVAGASGNAAYEASTVVSLYDPGMLQVRADVRLEDLPRVVPGQRVRIETAAAERPFEGEVLFATSLADVQKNTLEVKIAVLRPPVLLKPEMLVQVTFLAPPAAKDRANAGRKLRLFVPGQLVDRSGQGSFVWIADQTAGVARRRPVETAGAAGDLVEIVEGLDPASRLIVAGRQGLRDGDRIEVSGEDATLGIGPGAADEDAKPSPDANPSPAGKTNTP